MTETGKTRFRKALSFFKLHPELHAFQNILNSFDQIHTAPMTTEDWDPLEQTLKLSVLPSARFQHPILKSHESRAQFGFQIGEIIHESIHIVLWDIFFSGHQSPRSLEQFLDWSLIFEAAAFWYCDFFAIPLVQRELSQNSTTIFKRSTPSFALLNPNDIWTQKFGNTRAQRDQALLYYWSVLSGAAVSDSFHSENLVMIQKRLNHVRRGAHAMLPPLYRKYKGRFVFDSYFKAFCCPLKNTPQLSLVTPSMEPTIKGVMQFVIHQLPAIAKKTHKEVLAVSKRRTFQRTALRTLLTSDDNPRHLKKMEKAFAQISF